ncbi:MAG TPA: sterol desaturase family protein [Xanthobacteraceae bacterium]|nr:sterol desaturase family protein [Xanthobacteraceae bacterium]
MDWPPGIAYFLQKLSASFLSPGAQFSLTSLACALALAAAFLALRRTRAKRRIRIGTIARALFPRRILTSPSTGADFGYLFFNTLVYGLTFGWAVLSYQLLSNGIIAGMVGAFGPVQPPALPEFAVRAIVTVILFLAYELGYWVHHYLSHRIAFLWEFHKTHHSATVLTPVTSARVHPVDTVIFANIVAISTAIASGFANYFFGDSSYQYALSNTNIILVLFIYTYVHLQHSELWMPLRGLPGHIVLSPAHHQVHHSTDPAHFNKNLGSCLAIWDWAFGTLYVPGKQREKLRFGADTDPRYLHTFTGEFILPFARAFARLRGLIPAPRARAQAEEKNAAV